MTLRQRTLLGVALASLGLLLALLVSVRSETLTNFAELERTWLERDAGRAARALQAELANLNILVADWAEWDDAYAFIVDSNPEFVRSNLNTEAFRSLHVDLIAFVDTRGRLVWGRQLDTSAGELVPLSQEIAAHVRRGDRLVERDETDRILTGIVTLSRGPLAVASRALLTSEALGPARGVVVFGRLLGRKEFDRIGLMLDMSLEARPVTAEQPPDFASALLELSPRQRTTTRVLSPNRIAGYALVDDLYGAPALTLRVDEDRTVHAQGLRVARYLVGTLLAAVLVFALVMLLGLERTVLQRLRRLSGGLRDIGTRGDPKGRVEVDGSDELATLGADINRTLEAVERSGEALRVSEERYRRLVEFSPDGILIHVGGKVVFSNRRMAEILGYPDAGALLGLQVIDLVHEDYRDTVRQRISRVTGELAEVPMIEEKLLRADGSAVDVEVAAIPFGSPDRPAVQVVARDISSRKNLELQVRHAQKIEAIGQLAGGLAHDFNNLLQAILGGLEVLRVRGAAHERHDETITELEAHVRRGAALARQLLLFSRREVTKAERTDLNGVIVGARDLLRRVVRETIRIDLELAPEALPIVADRGQMEQVIVNLAMNASDAMPDGGIITIRSAAGQSEVRFEISDTGIGVPDAILPRIFEPFFTTKETGKGSGLGLAVVHGIVTHHGGSVEVRSRQGGGATFAVTMPRAPDPGDAWSPAETDRPGHLPEGRGERVLVVEDEDGARESLLEMLSLLGYRALGVDSGEEAGLVPAAPGFDVLLTDLVLPGIHGVELAVGLKERWPELRVIVMSGYAEDEALHWGVGAGKTRFLQKPFDLATLAQELHAALADGA